MPWLHKAWWATKDSSQAFEKNCTFLSTKEAEEIPKLEQTLVFLLQAVNQLDPEMSK